MQQTLLDMVQDILSSMGSDEVNSISDTTEAMDVARVIKTCYYNIIARANLPEHNGTFQLVPSNDPSKPVIMYRPANVSRLDWIKYNTATEDQPELFYNYVTILPFQQFIDRVNSYNPDNSNVEALILDDITYYYENDRAPTHCTILSDHTIIFDSYDQEMDDTLQESKTLCYGRVHPTFQMVDHYVPEMDPQQFPLLYNEAKSLAFLEIKQMGHEKAEQESRRQWRSLQKTKFVNTQSDFDKLPYYGRK